MYQVPLYIVVSLSFTSESMHTFGKIVQHQVLPAEQLHSWLPELILDPLDVLRYVVPDKSLRRINNWLSLQSKQIRKLISKILRNNLYLRIGGTTCKSVALWFLIESKKVFGLNSGNLLNKIFLLLCDYE